MEELKSQVFKEDEPTLTSALEQLLTYFPLKESLDESDFSYGIVKLEKKLLQYVHEFTGQDQQPLK